MNQVSGSGGRVGYAQGSTRDLAECLKIPYRAVCTSLCDIASLVDRLALDQQTFDYFCTRWRNNLFPGACLPSAGTATMESSGIHTAVFRREARTFCRHISLHIPIPISLLHLDRGHRGDWFSCLASQSLHHGMCPALLYVDKALASQSATLRLVLLHMHGASERSGLLGDFTDSNSPTLSLCLCAGLAYSLCLDIPRKVSRSTGFCGLYACRVILLALPSRIPFVLIIKPSLCVTGRVSFPPLEPSDRRSPDGFDVLLGTKHRGALGQ